MAHCGADRYSMYEITLIKKPLKTNNKTTTNYTTSYTIVYKQLLPMLMFTTCAANKAKTLHNGYIYTLKQIRKSLL